MCGKGKRGKFSIFVGIMTTFLFLGGKHVAAFYPIFLWIIIGNGIRFGERLLVTGLIMGSLGFGSLLVFHPFWRSQLEVGVGLLIGVVVLPIFFLTVLKRLRKVRKLEIELARSRLADKAKDQFLATMSHEIRTPMNGVLGVADILRQSQLDKQQLDHLDVITQSVESLLHIINDILDYSKITSNNLSLEEVPFDLKQVLGDVHQLLRSTADSKGIDLTFSYPPESHRHFMGDPTRVRQIAFNLVGNAIKFTKTGGVNISCRIGDSGGQHNVVLEIDDSGIGIPEDRRDAIFDQFEQADNSTTRQYGGTGIGLSISQKLAHLMNGMIEVKSVVDVGSTFTATLSLLECEKPAVKAEQVAQELPQFGLRALVAEDNKFNQVVVLNMLKRIDIKVDIAENGAKALEMLEPGKYDLIFMDIRMPVMNGYLATEEIRKRSDETAQIPILALTADATKNDRKKCLNAGMDYHLSKPLRIEHVIEAVESLDKLSALVSD